MGIRRVTYLSVLTKASQLWLGQASPSTEDAALLNTLINFRAGEYWEFFYWPELCLAERRQFRADWNSGTTYGGPSSSTAVEVYYATSRKYYQSLRAGNTGNAPAVAGTLVENSAFWAESAAAYSGNDWAASTTYAVGARVRNATDNRYYQCHTAHTSASSFDSSKFGILTPFVRDIDYDASFAPSTGIGEVKKVWDNDPYVYEESERCPIEFDLSDRGIIVRGCLAVVYPEFRLRVPSWTGSNYSATTTYAANDQVYDPTTGDYYFSIAGGNTGNPVTDTNFWTRIDFPYVLRDCVPQAAYADTCRVDGKNDLYPVEIAEAERMLRREVTKIELKQGQNKSLNVRTRRADVS